MPRLELAHEADIISSTGKPGLSRRSFNRLYANATRISGDPREAEANFQRLVRIGKKFSPKIGRVVFKGVVTEAVRRHIDESQLRPALEVALPLNEFGQAGDHLVYLAHNHPDRQPLTPIEEMVRETQDEYFAGYLDTLRRVERIKQKGYDFTPSIKDDEIDSVFSLWGPTFDWSRDGVVAFAARLQAESKLPPEQRTVWYSAIKNQGVVIALAMAERLSVPTSNGNLDIVESTEWRVHDDYAHRGLMAAALIHLNAQVLTDFYRSEQGPPLIFAECNFQTRSDRAGFRAGFQIPQRNIGEGPPQILVQNVGIGDGQNLPAHTLRDFSFMYVPVERLESDYNPAQVAEVLSTAGE